MSYTLGDAYTMEYWVDLAKENRKIWVQAQSVLKDMAGLLVPI